jgi:transcriptional regulator with XRE-family HTH domain
MGGRTWLPEHVETLKAMIAAGCTQLQVAERLGRTEEAVATRCRVLGAHNPEAARANSAAGVRAVRADPVRGAQIRRKIGAAYDPDRRAAAADRMRQVNARRQYAPLPQERKERIRAGATKFHRRKWAWLPDAYREQYRRIAKKTCAAEARRLILEQIAADEARLSPFERQMRALTKGAQLVAKPVLRRRDSDFTLGGVTDYAA